ncbi:MAG: endonuclease III domain-containing protein [Methanobacteriota archaeon]
MDATREGLLRVYDALFKAYGFQGWWPITSKACEGKFHEGGYHPGDYKVPESPGDKLEVAVGAILTQSTSWKNVEKAIARLQGAGIVTLDALKRTPKPLLSNLIKSSLYHNVKAEKLKCFAEFVNKEFDGDIEALLELPVGELRLMLLSIWGVGPETADSIILYAAKKPSFVVDTYTKRFFSRLGFLNGDESYDEVKKYFEENLPRQVSLYNEYHALIVEHAKRHCKVRPECTECPLHEKCKYKTEKM